MAADLDDLYDADFYAWTRDQAKALRRLAETRPNAPVDWAHVIEEIESVGRSQLNAVESRIRLIFVHLAKAVSLPASPSQGHWRAECASWQGDLVQALAPSMHQRLDLDAIWRRSLRQAQLALEEHGASLHPALPATAPLAAPGRGVARDADDFRLRARAALMLGESGVAPERVREIHPLGVLEHAWTDAHGRFHEINLVFAATALGLSPAARVASLEDHIAFDWIPLSSLPETDLRPAAIRPRLKDWLAGGGRWWSTSVS